MIKGIGCDIVKIELVTKLNWDKNENIRSRIFSDREIKLYEKTKKHSFLSGRFAAKECVVKCLGTGMFDGIALNDIEVLQLENGKPYIELKGNVKKISDSFGINKWFVSISHSQEHSISYVIAECSN